MFLIKGLLYQAARSALHLGSATIICSPNTRLKAALFTVLPV